MRSNIKIVQRDVMDKGIDDEGKPTVIVDVKTVDVRLEGDNAIVTEILGYLNSHYTVE